MSICPPELAKSKPKEPEKFWGHNLRKKCKKHNCAFSMEEGWDEDEYYCAKCQKEYEKKYQKWFHKWGHIVAASYDMIVENGKIIMPGHDLRYMQFLHGGKPIKIGSWCKIDKNTGFIKYARNHGNPRMIVVA